MKKKKNRSGTYCLIIQEYNENQLDELNHQARSYEQNENKEMIDNIKIRKLPYLRASRIIQYNAVDYIDGKRAPYSRMFSVFMKLFQLQI